MRRECGCQVRRSETFLMIDLSDQRLTIDDEKKQVVRVIPVSTGKASTPKPIFESKMLTK